MTIHNKAKVVVSPPSHSKRRRVMLATSSGDSGSDSDCDAVPHHMDLETPTPSSASSPLTEPEEDDEEEFKHKHKHQSPPKINLKSIIEQQFDLEILLKHRELRTIEDRIAQVETLMVQMRKLHKDSGKNTVEGEPRDFVQRYAHYLKDKHDIPPAESTPVAPNVVPMDEAPSRRIRHPTAKLASNGGYIGRGPVVQCIYRRPDGVLVQLVCQDCGRSNFGSTQGFINHCRISHARDYGSHDSAAIACGVEVEEQDEKGRASLKQLGRDVIRPPPKQPATPMFRDRSFSTSAVVGRAISSAELQSLKPQRVALAQPTMSTLPPPPKKFIPPPKITSFDNLEKLLEERKIAQDVDFKMLVKTSQEPVPKAHLFEDEDESEDDEDQQAQLGEDATPFERVIAEARKLKLNVDELIAQGKANGNRPSGFKPARRSSATTKNRKKSGSASSDSPLELQSQSPSEKPSPVPPVDSPPCLPSPLAAPLVENTSKPKTKPQRRISISTPSTRSSTRAAAASCRAQQNEEQEGSRIVSQLSKFLSMDRFF